MKSIEKLNAELIEAAKNGEQDRIAVLVNGGADVNARDKDGYTALHIAAIHNNPESIQKQPFKSRLLYSVKPSFTQLPTVLFTNNTLIFNILNINY